MNNTVEEDIYNALKELIDSQFSEFKWRLKLINYDGRPNIPEASLDKADQKKVADLLIQHYTEDALEVCILVLRKCNRNDLAKKLEETGQKDVDAHQLPDLSDYRNYIKKKFETMKDPNAVPGEYVLLNQRYSKLMILDYHLSKEEREDEILAIGRKHREMISKRAESSTSIETLFNPDKHGLIPQVVVLQGAAGIGKTIMAKKIMFDWAAQQLYQDKFNYVFYICCRKMNLHAETEMHSIAEIISEGWLKCHELKNVIRNILKNEDKLLFIIDGFDELYSFDQSEDSFCSDPWKKEPVRILLSSLFQKKLLPKSSLIITTRPTALEKLHQCLERPGYFEILGFSTKEREEYFYNFFGNKDQAIQALRFVKQNETLFTMCVIPLVSWIICTVIKQEMERGKDLQKTPYTLTAIYMLYLSSLLKFHHKEPKQDVQSNVKGFCSLAAEGILKKKILFMEEEVKKHILDQGNSLPLFLNQSIFKEDIDCIQTYSFIHLSFQEFFAALFYVLDEGDEQHSQNLNENLQTLLERHNSFGTDFAVGFHFLFGFLNEGGKMKELKKKFGWEISPKNKEFVLDWVKDHFKKRIYNFQLQKEIFSCLYETQDDNFIKNALCGITKIHDDWNSDMELMILSYCIQHCQNLKDLSFNCSYIQRHMKTESFLSENEDWSLHERYVEDFFKGLTKLRNLEVLCLLGCSFKESCSRHLAEVFKNNQRLKTLRLDVNDIDDRTAELLCEVLQDPDCKIEELQLLGEILTESCSRHVAEVFRKNQRLRKLLLHVRYRDEKIMERLCDGLKHPQCTIEILVLKEILTESCSRHLAEVFWRNQRLRKLLLHVSYRDDKIMERLCDGLKHPQCTIEILVLFGEILIESCSRHLAEVFWRNQRLRKLSLDISYRDEKITERLFDGLKHPECTIETLELQGKLWSEICNRHFAEVLSKNQRLNELHLSLQELDDKPMEVLCEVLKHPECSIGTLQLAGEILSESSSRHLAEVLRKNQRLNELHLSLQEPDDKPMEVLCEGLKHPECSIGTLQLAGEILSESSSRHLAEVLSKNQRLKVLYWSLQEPDDKPMEVLCEGLKYPECSIGTLQLAGAILSESSSRHLAEVLRKNQRLRTLYLSLKKPDDKPMEVLCEGLKQPECTIETLKLDAEIPTESCIRHLAEVLRKNQRLNVLYLSRKRPDDKPMEVLCEGLKHPECSIETLQLAGAILSESSSRHLAEVLRKNQRLRTLYLSLKKPDDKPMEVLCEGLKQPECTIETLKLDAEIPTESCIRHLAEVLRKNQRLNVLYLSLKRPDDKPMEVLCEGLKHPECSIETLQLVGVILSESSSRHLGEVLRKNQRLRTLYLSLKKLDDKPMEVLCEGLKQPECTIQTLQLHVDISSESCSRHLAEVLRKNQRLRELDLSFKSPDDKTMKLLCNGLNNPECRIKNLKLNGKYIIQNGKWNETAMVESPARIRGGVKRLASSESSQNRKRRRTDRFQNT